MADLFYVKNVVGRNTQEGLYNLGGTLKKKGDVGDVMRERKQKTTGDKREPTDTSNPRYKITKLRKTGLRGQNPTSVSHISGPNVITQGGKGQKNEGGGHDWYKRKKKPSPMPLLAPYFSIKNGEGLRAYYVIKVGKSSGEKLPNRGVWTGCSKIKVREGRRKVDILGDDFTLWAVVR